MSLTSAIAVLKNEMKMAGIAPDGGLGTELFLFSSTLAPVINVDLLVTNRRHEILLAWRDDPHTGTGWHIPGGCVRFRERLAERVHKTAVAELGEDVILSPEPVKVFEIFSDQYRQGIEEQDERAHFITLAYGCRFKAEGTAPEYQKEIYKGKAVIRYFRLETEPGGRNGTSLQNP